MPERALDVFPGQSLSNVSNCTPGHIESRCNRSLCLAHSQCVFDKYHRIGIEFGSGVDQFFYGNIVHVFHVCALSQVMRIATRRIVTRMQHVIPGLRITVCQDVSHAGSQGALTLIACHPITTCVSRCHERPALIGVAAIHVNPEPIGLTTIRDKYPSFCCCNCSRILRSRHKQRLEWTVKRCAQGSRNTPAYRPFSLASSGQSSAGQTQLYFENLLVPAGVQNRGLESRSGMKSLQRVVHFHG